MKNLHLTNLHFPRRDLIQKRPWSRISEDEGELSSASQYSARSKPTIYILRGTLGVITDIQFSTVIVDVLYFALSYSFHAMKIFSKIPTDGQILYSLYSIHYDQSKKK